MHHHHHHHHPVAGAVVVGAVAGAAVASHHHHHHHHHPVATAVVATHVAVHHPVAAVVHHTTHMLIGRQDTARNLQSNFDYRHVWKNLSMMGTEHVDSCTNDAIELTSMIELSSKKKSVKKMKIPRPEDKNEKKCRLLFEEMNSQKTKMKIFNTWRPLHDLYTKNPFDYESFKSEYAKFVAASKRGVTNHSPSVNQKYGIKSSVPEVQHRGVPERPFVNIIVNGVSTKALIDTGAYCTSMPLVFARNAKLENQIDTRYRRRSHKIDRIVKPVGTIHSCSIKIGKSSYDIQVRVLHTAAYVILGIDFLRCSNLFIDIAKNILTFDGKRAEILSDYVSDERKLGRNAFAHDPFKVDEDKKNKLTRMGFDSEEAASALTETMNDFADTAESLFFKTQMEARVSEIELTEKEEECCRSIFEKMGHPQAKSMVYKAWTLLHDQYTAHPSDYEGFKQEYSRFAAANWKKWELMKDKSSEIGQALLSGERRRYACDQILETVKQKAPSPCSMKIYINVFINGITTSALVDTGASRTKMPLSLAKQAGLFRKIDKRTEVRVLINGSFPTVGVLNSCFIEINSILFDASMDVVDSNTELTIGVDFLLRHKCSIDLATNSMMLNDKTQVQFVSESKKHYGDKANEKPFGVTRSFKVDEAKLAKLMAMGFEEDDSRKALMQTINCFVDALERLYAMEYLRQKTR